MARVDCDSKKGQPLCIKMMIDSFPVVQYIPLHSNISYFNVSHMRNLAGLTRFALEDGYKEGQEEFEIPKPAKTMYHAAKSTATDVIDSIKLKFLV